MARPCPHCGGSCQPQAGPRHRWWCCGRCGSAHRTGRPSAPPWFPAERYTRPSAEGTPFAHEVAQFEALLRRLDLCLHGRVLDLGGGPGFVAAALRGGHPAITDVRMTDVVPHIVAFARDQLGVDAVLHDFAEPLPCDAADWVLLRNSLPWCADLRFLVDEIARVGARSVLIAGWVPPSRGAVLNSAFEPGAPVALWSERALRQTFLEAGFGLRKRFRVHPPMACWGTGRRRSALARLPWAFVPGPLPMGWIQTHPGLLFERGPWCPPHGTPAAPAG